MKRIILPTERFYDRIAVLDEYKGGKVPQSCIFLVIGSFFSIPNNKTRKEVEIFGLKNYIRDISPLVIADSEESFLFNFFENGNHENIDIFNIYSCNEIESFYNYIKKDVKHDLPRKRLIKNFFSGEKVMYDQLYYLSKYENLQERTISRIIYDEDTIEEKEKILQNLINKGYIITGLLNTTFIMDIHKQIKKIINGEHKKYPNDYYPNPLIYYSQIKEDIGVNSFSEYMDLVQSAPNEIYDEDSQDNLYRLKLFK